MTTTEIIARLVTKTGSDPGTGTGALRSKELELIARIRGIDHARDEESRRNANP